MQSLISIIVPVYNVEAWLRQCIDSIINQTYRNLDIILIDDGSTDRCGEICDEYAAKDVRIRVFHTENQGLSGSRNFGIEKAMESRSEYIGFVDGDDWIEPDMFEVLLRYAEESGSEVVYSAGYIEHLSHTFRTIGPLMKDKKVNRTEALKALIKGHIGTGVWNKLWKKECFKEIRFPQGHVFEDTATVYKVFSVVNSIRVIPNVLYHHRYRKDSISHIYSTTCSMANLIDYYLAHKSRFDYFKEDCRFNTDNEVMEQLLFYCAISIKRTWLWYYASTKEEREKYSLQVEEMRAFSKRHFPRFGKRDWSLKLRLCIFMQKFNSPIVFPVLYYINHFYRWCRKRQDNF